MGSRPATEQIARRVRAVQASRRQRRASRTVVPETETRVPRDCEVRRMMPMIRVAFEPLAMDGLP